MAGLEDYKRHYGSRSMDNLDLNASLPSKYRGRDVIRPLDVPPQLTPLPEDDSPMEDDLTIKKYIGLGCGLASLITENLLIHPFIVLRRQCQVNPGAKRYHLVPITLIPVMIRLHKTQGLNTLWKGIGSTLLVRGLTMAVEDILSKFTPWPKEITCNSTLRAFGQHILLKCVSMGLVAPFYSASLVETVQSEIASERPGILDVFRDGALRLVEVSSKGRMIPIYVLLPPTIALGAVKYLFSLVVKGVASRIMHIKHRHNQQIRGAYSRDIVSENAMQDIELKSILVSMLATDVVFYPLETVIHRLHLQGTRTIIDNLDTGMSVLPLLTGYSGAVDCYRTIIATEGTLGLYKGFGALVMQFAVHVFVLHSTKWLLTELGAMLRTNPKPAKIPQYTSYYNEI